MNLKGAELKPDRYYTPQVKNPTGPIYSSSRYILLTTSRCTCKLIISNINIAYEPTPSPETVVFNKKARTPKNESCCLAW
jgi:hypothetical protein